MAGVFRRLHRLGDFFVIEVMSGGGSASVVGALYEDVGVLQYPSAAASAALSACRPMRRESEASVCGRPYMVA